MSHLVDLRYLDPKTAIGRLQIAELLRREYGISDEIITWFFSQLDREEEPVHRRPEPTFLL